ncbi:hypothetical protein [Microcystis phage Mwe-JY05]
MAPNLEVYPLLTGPDNRVRFAWSITDPDRESTLTSGTQFTARSDAHADAARWRHLLARADIVDRDYPHRGGRRVPEIGDPAPAAS